MDNIKMIIKIISLIVVAIGIIMIYDARKLSKKWFSYADQNESTKIFKIVGFIVSILGSIIVIINM